MVPARRLHPIRDAHGLGVTTAAPSAHMAQEPLDHQHRESSSSKQPPPHDSHGEAPDEHRLLQLTGGVASQEAAGTSGSGNDGAGDWLRLGLAPASSSRGAVRAAESSQLDIFADRARPPVVQPQPPPPPGMGVPPVAPGIPQESITLPAPRAGPPWMPPSRPAASWFSAPPPTLPFAHRTFYTPGAGGDTIRVVLPPAASAGVWFALQASPHQGREPFLPQIPRSFLRIKDVSVTVRLLIKYLATKLGLEDESEVEITCRGRPILPFLTLQHVRDSIWCQGDAVSPPVAPDTSAANHLMVLQYGRRPYVGR